MVKRSCVNTRHTVTLLGEEIHQTYKIRAAIVLRPTGVEIRQISLRAGNVRPFFEILSFRYIHDPFRFVKLVSAQN